MSADNDACFYVLDARTVVGNAPNLDALVASPWWQWRLGMMHVTDQGVRGVISHVFDDGWIEVTYRLRPGNCGSRDGHHRAFFAPDCQGMRPDIDHGGTQGEMLALVRKAYGPECRVDITVYEDGNASVDVFERRRGAVHEFAGDTLGLVLAAALLAAPAPKACEP